MHYPNQSFSRAEIKKMGPDPADLHILGGGAKRRKKRGRLKKITKE